MTDRPEGNYHVKLKRGDSYAGGFIWGWTVARWQPGIEGFESPKFAAWYVAGSGRKFKDSDLAMIGPK